MPACSILNPNRAYVQISTEKLFKALLFCYVRQYEKRFIMKATTAAVMGAGIFTLGLTAGLGLSFNRAATPCAPDTAHKIIFNKDEIFTARAVKIHDGDSLMVIYNGHNYSLRLWGVDAYELRQNCHTGSGIVACGRMAQQNVEDMALDTEIMCRNKTAKSSYDRVVAQCFVGDKDIGRAQIRQGLAVAFPHDGPYKGDEEDARASRVGMWNTDIPNMTPQNWRACHHSGRSELKPGDSCRG